MRPPTGESAREQGRELHERPRSVTQRALEPDSLPTRALHEHERATIARNAQQRGLLASIAAGVVSGALVLAANRFSPRFRSALGVSGKTALIVTPTAGSFFLQSHLAIAQATADPAGYLNKSTLDGSIDGRPEPLTHLQPWHRLANGVYENPFKTIFGTVVPLYGLIFYRESTHPSTANMLLSQRLIHTRVYGQAIAVLTTVVVMGLCDSMKDGPYVAVPVAAGEHGVGVSADAGQTVEGEPRDGNWGLLVPLIYAPLVPTLVVVLRGRVRQETLHRVVLGAVLLALTHAGSVMFSDSSVM